MSSVPNEPESHEAGVDAVGEDSGFAPEPERRIGRRKRAGLRRRASAREIERERQALIAEEKRRTSSVSAVEAERRAEARLHAMLAEDPKLGRKLRLVEPTSRAPQAGRIDPFAELAAAVSFFPGLLQRLASTLGGRGPVPDLSGAVAALVWMSTGSGSSIARSAFRDLQTNFALRFALGFPSIKSRSQLYRDVITVTGRGKEKPGHDPALAVAENIRLIRQLAELRDESGALHHPRFGRVGIVDGTRRYAPILQRWPASEEHLAVLRRPGMEMVSPSRYAHGNQYDDGIGWRVHELLDQATSLPLVWAVTTARSKEPDDERTVLMERLLPMLFRLWPECPMDTLIGDAGYDADEVCWELENRWSIHPVFSRPTARSRPIKRKRKPDIHATDGVPKCPTCREPMEYWKHEGFYDLSKRREDGLTRGQLAPPHRRKAARVRWRCAKPACSQTVDAWHDANPADHTYYPRDGKSGPGIERRALERYRNPAESLFAGLSVRGIGTDDLRCLWARDEGFAWLASLYGLLMTARRLAHETGRYARFLGEAEQLGLDSADQIPSRERAQQMALLRPTAERWAWPEPGRAAA
jgi:hypothetical protein